VAAAIAYRAMMREPEPEPEPVKKRRIRGVRRKALVPA
jgi:hypothetical protein